MEPDHWHIDSAGDAGWWTKARYRLIELIAGRDAVMVNCVLSFMPGQHAIGRRPGSKFLMSNCQTYYGEADTFPQIGVTITEDEDGE